jgi:hypothetical protein
MKQLFDISVLYAFKAKITVIKTKHPFNLYESRACKFCPKTIPGYLNYLGCITISPENVIFARCFSIIKNIIYGTITNHRTVDVRIV